MSICPVCQPSGHSVADHVNSRIFLIILQKSGDYYYTQRFSQVSYIEFSFQNYEHSQIDKFTMKYMAMDHNATILTLNEEKKKRLKKMVKQINYGLSQIEQYKGQ